MLSMVGTMLIKVAGIKISKFGPHNSAKNNAGIARQPKYTTHTTLAAWGK